MTLAEELEALDVAYIDAMKRGDAAKMHELDVKRRVLDPPPVRPKPPSYGDGKTWRDIGDGWEELSIRPQAGIARIRGIASSDEINSHDYALSPKGMIAELPIPLRAEHSLVGKGVGDIFLVRRNDRITYIEGQIDDNAAGRFALQKLVDGHYRSLSLAMAQSRKHYEPTAEVAGKLFIGKWLAGECSLCVRGANPSAQCELMTDEMASGWREYVETAAPPAPLGADTTGKINYRGVWDADREYKSGQFVTDKGALWAATVTSKGCRPGDGSLWKLAVKRGALEKTEATDV